MKVIGLALLVNGEVKVTLQDDEKKQTNNRDVFLPREETRSLYIGQEVDLRIIPREGAA